MPWNLVRGDISRVKADAIVNAANNGLRQGSGVCGAIFAAAGEEELRRACKEIGHCDTGKSVLTPAFRLNARYIIHTVGPVWVDGAQGEEQLLRSAYESALTLAAEHGCESIAFPLISAGVYGYPREAALQIALESFERFLDGQDMDISLVIYDHSNPISNRRVYMTVGEYLQERHVGDEGLLNSPIQAQEKRQRKRFKGKAEMHFKSESALAPDDDYESFAGMCCAASVRPVCGVPDMDELKKRLAEQDASFSATLFRMIDERGLSDVEVYKGANLDRKLFSKLRHEDYRPSKYTVVALAISMKLSLKETEDLLSRAGLAFSPNSTFDIIVEYFLENRIFDIFVINEVLFDFDQHLLGA